MARACRICSAQLDRRNRHGFCAQHWNERRRATTRSCKCGVAIERKSKTGLCVACYNAARKWPTKPCGVCGHDIPVGSTSGLCGVHYREARKAFAEARQIARARADLGPPRDPLYYQRATVLAAKLVGATAADLIGRARRRELVRARWTVFAGMRDRGVSLPRIGRRFGRDHVTVLYGLTEARLLAARDPHFRVLLEKVASA